MKSYILIGSEDRRAEWLEQLPQNLPAWQGEQLPADLFGAGYDGVVDLDLDEYADRIAFYAQLDGMPVLGCAVKCSLAEMVYSLGATLRCKLFGINALPGFLKREVWEVSCLQSDDAPVLATTMEGLGHDYEQVQDRVGMVTPRVLFMILNEAWDLRQEGTASEEDVDLAMRLGVNYPDGPFAWARSIGLRHIVEVLDALHSDTGQSRFRVSAALRREMMIGASR